MLSNTEYSLESHFLCCVSISENEQFSVHKILNSKNVCQRKHSNIETNVCSGALQDSRAIDN